MESPFRRNNHEQKKPKQSPDTTTENTKTVIDESSKNKRIKNRTKSEMKGGNISDIHTISGRELIEQAFS